jgi:hypothetical protein
MTVGLKVKVLWDVVICWLVSGYLVTSEFTQHSIPEDISIQFEIRLLYLMCCNMLWHRFFSHMKYGSKEHLNESKEGVFQCEVQLCFCSVCCFIPYWSWYWFIADLDSPPPQSQSPVSILMFLLLFYPVSKHVLCKSYIYLWGLGFL